MAIQEGFEVGLLVRIDESGFRIAQLHDEELALALQAVLNDPAFMPIDLGLLAWVKLQRHEHLFLTM